MKEENFIQSLEHEYKRLFHYEVPIFMIMIEINNFELLNDTHGVYCGNRAVEYLNDVCKRYMNDDGELSRLTENIFSMILPNSFLDSTIETAEKIRRNFILMDSAHKEVPRFSVSIGIVSIQQHYDMQTNIQHANKTLHQAKELGRNKVVYLSA